MKTVGSRVRGGNLALVLFGAFLVFLGLTATFSTGLGVSSLAVIGFPVSNILMVVLGFVFILLGLRSGVRPAVVKTGG